MARNTEWFSVGRVGTSRVIGVEDVLQCRRCINTASCADQGDDAGNAGRRTRQRGVLSERGYRGRARVLARIGVECCGVDAVTHHGEVLAVSR
jgi:hypothetical protein